MDVRLRFTAIIFERHSLGEICPSIEGFKEIFFVVEKSSRKEPDFISIVVTDCQIFGQKFDGCTFAPFKQTILRSEGRSSANVLLKLLSLSLFS